MSIFTYICHTAPPPILKLSLGMVSPNSPPTLWKETVGCDLSRPFFAAKHTKGGGWVSAADRPSPAALGLGDLQRPAAAHDPRDGDGLVALGPREQGNMEAHRDALTTTHSPGWRETRHNKIMSSENFCRLYFPQTMPISSGTFAFIDKAALRSRKYKTDPKTPRM